MPKETQPLTTTLLSTSITQVIQQLMVAEQTPRVLPQQEATVQLVRRQVLLLSRAKLTTE